jgi:flagellin
MSIRLNGFVNTGYAVANLNSAVQRVQDSLGRLSSGSRIQKTSDDAGGSAVSLKFGSAIRRTEAAANNLLNLISFLQVQDSALETIAKGITRMMELKSLSLDPTKSASDIQNYSTEFSQIRQSLVDVSLSKFNGVDLFSHSGSDTVMNVGSDEGGQIQASATQFALGVGATSWLSPTASYQFVPGAFTWENALADAQSKGGTLASITSAAKWGEISASLGADASRLMWIGGFQPLGSAEPSTGWSWIDGEPFDYTNWVPGNPDNHLPNQNFIWMANGAWDDIDTASATTVEGYLLNSASIALSNPESTLEYALQYIANCRAKNGADTSAASRWLDNAKTHSISLETANSKISDVDVAGESTRLSRANVLAQSAASALAQGNAAQNVIVKLVNG